MKIRIEVAQCVGDARRHAVAEKPYSLDDEGDIATESLEVQPGEKGFARKNAQSSPEPIISVIEHDITALFT